MCFWNVLRYFLWQNNMSEMSMKFIVLKKKKKTWPRSLLLILTGIHKFGHSIFPNTEFDRLPW